MAPWWREARAGTGHPGCTIATPPRGLRGRPAGYPTADPTEEDTDMADPVPAGSDVSAGTYKCTNCGYELEVGSTKNLPPCPSCHNGQYQTLSGGDSSEDPYPERS
jgi:hypothetical protein